MENITGYWKGTGTVRVPEGVGSCICIGITGTKCIYMNRWCIANSCDVCVCVCVQVVPCVCVCVYTLRQCMCACVHACVFCTESSFSFSGSRTSP